ncbi:hypothetical protein PILCRDRAFT_17405 [Piloderma croceum F 1598]|uniref:Uncharacterized protein n=1 Tax=Piloderma croceum (strain F 1598) TaxID=765440 RepID=A0A0C3B1F4_PILCF|nr:hypothetical protein PILCRDRAFT_17405 [Piloderma croceum F 1598]
MSDIDSHSTCNSSTSDALDAGFPALFQECDSDSNTSSGEDSRMDDLPELEDETEWEDSDSDSDSGSPDWHSLSDVLEVLAIVEEDDIARTIMRDRHWIIPRHMQPIPLTRIHTSYYIACSHRSRPNGSP